VPDFSTFKPSIGPGQRDYVTKLAAMMDELDARFNTSAAFNGNVAIGNAGTDTLTIAPSAVTWSNNPTHSGNHTFSGNVTVNGNTTIGNATSDTLVITATTEIGRSSTSNAPFLKAATWDLLKWSSSDRLGFGGITASQWSALDIYTGGAIRGSFTSTGLNDCAIGVTTPKFVGTAASATGGAGLRLPHGAAPTSPVDGDVWTTTTGVFARVNGVTKTFTLT
jgi:hypothetical protein